MKLTIYAIESKPIVAIKAIREALRKLNPDANPIADLGEARRLHAAFTHGAEATIGETTDDHEGFDALRDALEANGVFVTALDPEKAAQRHEAAKMTASGATPEDVFAAQAPGKATLTLIHGEDDPESGFDPSEAHKLAIALIVMMDGQPLHAAAHAMVLARAQGAESNDYWAEVQDVIIELYPAVEAALEADGSRL